LITTPQVSLVFGLTLWPLLAASFSSVSSMGGCRQFRAEVLEITADPLSADFEEITLRNLDQADVQEKIKNHRFGPIKFEKDRLYTVSIKKGRICQVARLESKN
jgi:hypothetical protein